MVWVASHARRFRSVPAGRLLLLLLATLTTAISSLINADFSFATTCGTWTRQETQATAPTAPAGFNLQTPALAAGNYDLRFRISISDTVAAGKILQVQHRTSGGSVIRTIGAGTPNSGNVEYSLDDYTISANDTLNILNGTVAGAANSRWFAAVDYRLACDENVGIVASSPLDVNVVSGLSATESWLSQIDSNTESPLQSIDTRLSAIDNSTTSATSRLQSLVTGQVTENTTLSNMEARIATTNTKLNGGLPAALDGSGNLKVSASAPASSVTVTNFPTTQPVSGTVNIGNFPSAFGVNNFPATQPVSGTVGVNNFPATQSVSGTVGVNNFPAKQTVAISQTGTENDVDSSGGGGGSTDLTATNVKLDTVHSDMEWSIYTLALLCAAFLTYIGLNRMFARWLPE